MTTIKSSLVSLLIVLPIILFGACSDDKEGNELQIPGGKKTVLDKSTFTKAVEVKANLAWDITLPADADWLKVKQRVDGFDLLAEPNESNALRSAKIVIKGDGLQDSYQVDQEPTDVDLRLIAANQSETWLYYHQTECEFFVYSQSPWTLSSDNSWATIDIRSGNAGSTKVKVTFDANVEKTKRESVLTLSLSTTEKSVKHTLIQRGKKMFDDATHHFYVHRATFPVLYSGIHMLTHNKPSYLIDTRNTLLTEALPGHVKHLEIDDFPNNLKDIIRKIDAEDPESVFAYYAEDLRIYHAVSMFTSLGIDTSRVRITIFPDGAGAYLSCFNTPFGKENEGGERYKEIQTAFENFYSARINNPSIGLQDAVQSTVEPNMPEIFLEAPHIMSSYSNFRFFIQDMNYLITDDTYVRNEIAKNNYIVKTPKDYLEELSPSLQETFYKMTGFDKQTYLAMFTASPKPNLIILGTNTNDNPENPAKRQEAYVKEIMDTYSKDYDIFYKAHPADNAYKDYETKFPGLKLIMPAKMPFDVFTWALNDQIDAIGGFNSSVFLSMPLDKVKFMFAAEAQDLGAVFYDLFKDRDDIYWINK